ncbi:hypothetical protein [Sphingomonas sp. GB1N7]
MRTTRGDAIPLFNYGPGIEQLRAKALAETGFEPPKPSVRQPAYAIAAE